MLFPKVSFFLSQEVIAISNYSMFQISWWSSSKREMTVINSRFQQDQKLPEDTKHPFVLNAKDHFLGHATTNVNILYSKMPQTSFNIVFFIFGIQQFLWSFFNDCVQHHRLLGEKVEYKIANLLDYCNAISQWQLTCLHRRGRRLYWSLDYCSRTDKFYYCPFTCSLIRWLDF